MRVDQLQEKQWCEKPCGHEQTGNRKFLIQKIQKLVPSKEKEANASGHSPWGQQDTGRSHLMENNAMTRVA